MTLVSRRVRSRGEGLQQEGTHQGFLQRVWGRAESARGDGLARDGLSTVGAGLSAEEEFHLASCVRRADASLCGFPRG